MPIRDYALMENSSIGDVQYASEKFAAAVDTLATGQGEIRERLLHAAILIVPVFDRDIPRDLKADFESLKEAVTGGDAPAGQEGQLASAIREMTPEIAAQNAGRLVELAHRLRRAVDRQG